MVVEVVAGDSEKRGAFIDGKASKAGVVILLILICGEVPLLVLINCEA